MVHTPGNSKPGLEGRLFDREAKDELEQRTLAPFALRGANSRGRALPEDQDELRTAFERDRDRIVHCTAFRRLMYKTQVFVNWEGDHNRTRLSHSLEVAQVARSVGSALRLNETFCEALALAHDLGHPPFGHRGEWALDGLMKQHGGFRHNAQVLRVVDRLERRSPDYSGLNLTRELRESLLKHEKGADWPAEFEPRPRQAYLEAQVVDLADSTAYNVHDLEDGLRSGMFPETDLEQEVDLWRLARERVAARHPGFLKSTQDINLRVKRTSNELLKLCILDLIEVSAGRLDRAGLVAAQDARERRSLLIGHSVQRRREVAQLHTFLHKRFYRHPHLQELTHRAAATLEALFEALCRQPQEMAVWYQSWAAEVGLERAVCDYIAGMTDRFAQREYERLCGAQPNTKSAAKRPRSKVNPRTAQA